MYVNAFFSGIKDGRLSNKAMDSDLRKVYIREGNLQNILKNAHRNYKDKRLKKTSEGILFPSTEFTLSRAEVPGTLDFMKKKDE